MRNGVWTAHSLGLAFFFGPTGILSHLVRSPCDLNKKALATPPIISILDSPHESFEYKQIQQLTRGVVRVFRWDVQDIMTAGTKDVAPSAADGMAKQMISDAEKQVCGSIQSMGVSDVC